MPGSWRQTPANYGSPIRLRSSKSIVAGYLLLLVPVLAACSQNPVTSQPLTTVSPDEQMQAFNTVSDLAIGSNRYAFVLLTADGSEVRDAGVSVAFYFIDGDQALPQGSAVAEYEVMDIEVPHEHEGGELHAHQEVHGFYVVRKTNFNRAGNWGAVISIESDAANSVMRANLFFQVREQSFTPALGQPIPNAETPVVNATADPTLLCSRVPPDDMHSISVDQALASGKPFVVVFASPSFCQTRICGPVTELVNDVKGNYRGEVIFIHIEPYDLSALRSQGEFVLVESAKQWGLPSEPWVFVVNEQGELAAKFEGLFGEEELSQAIQNAY